MSDIRLNASSCSQSFHELCTSLREAAPAIRNLLQPSSLEDEYGRFRVWAANLGVLQKGHSSLDYRLRASPLLNTNVIKLLKELQLNLKEAIAVVRGSRLPYEQQAEDSNDTDSDVSDDSSVVDSSNGEGPQTELEQRFLELTDINDNLYKLSISIRTPTLASRSLKAGTFKQVDRETNIDVFSGIHGYAAFDRRFTREVAKDLRRTAGNKLQEDDFLIERLARAITKRRQHFRYWRKHREKLADLPKDDAYTSRATETQDQADVRNISREVEQLPEAIKIDCVPASEAATKTLMSGTEATAHHRTLDDAVDSQSVTSIATTTRDVSGPTVDLPPPPTSATGRTYSKISNLTCVRTATALILNNSFEPVVNGQITKAAYIGSFGDVRHIQIACINLLQPSRTTSAQAIQNFSQSSKSAVYFLWGRLPVSMSVNLVLLAAFALPRDAQTAEDCSGASNDALQGRSGTGWSSREKSSNTSVELADLNGRARSAKLTTDEASPIQEVEDLQSLAWSAYRNYVDAYKLSKDAYTVFDDPSPELRHLSMSMLGLHIALKDLAEGWRGDLIRSEHASAIWSWRALLAKTDSFLSQPAALASPAKLTKAETELTSLTAIVRSLTAECRKLKAEGSGTELSVEALKQVPDATLDKLRSLGLLSAAPDETSSLSETAVLPVEPPVPAQTPSPNLDRDSSAPLTLNMIPTISELYRRLQLNPVRAKKPPDATFNQKISVFLSDLTELQVDAIVNPTDRLLENSRDIGTLNYRVHTAAGPDLERQCRAIGVCEVGDAVITLAYGLPCRRVIHAVRPYYRRSGGGKDHERLLWSCYMRSLEIAIANGLKSIAFPTLSAGGYRFPTEEAALCAIGAIREFLDSGYGESLERIIFCVFTNEDYDCYRDSIPLYFPPTDLVSETHHASVTESEGIALGPRPQQELDFPLEDDLELTPENHERCIDCQLQTPRLPEQEEQPDTESMLKSRDARVGIVEPAKAFSPPHPVKGILRKPTKEFPEDLNPTVEGVALLKDAKKDKNIPRGARWTKIDRKLVSPQALEEANERFVERMDSVIVLRVLTKAEIQKFADRTAEISSRNQSSAGKIFPAGQGPSGTFDHGDSQGRITYDRTADPESSLATLSLFLKTAIFSVNDSHAIIQSKYGVDEGIESLRSTLLNLALVVEDLKEHCNSLREGQVPLHWSGIIRSTALLLARDLEHLHEDISAMTPLAQRIESMPSGYKHSVTAAAGQPSLGAQDGPVMEFFEAVSRLLPTTLKLYTRLSQRLKLVHTQNRDIDRLRDTLTTLAYLMADIRDDYSILGTARTSVAEELQSSTTGIMGVLNELQVEVAKEYEWTREHTSYIPRLTPAKISSYERQLSIGRSDLAILREQMQLELANFQHTTSEIAPESAPQASSAAKSAKQEG
ncbi:hypothetical protein W97_02078 [Coniosporium apollinis CBS 100218]|uniref:Macro domain-containing protein n=1 Tax=Coniosporium apollinis (strain CBS 100218) TaxID=1168221 RepID=R7YLV2_CONA1|nr:uncharacterized protein W97_02078 [Coniosporium apollinis CBS 100218]EON62853.1 hypothetical protein W97_02078 [Coniosporium apollinis CBS 100218]